MARRRRLVSSVTEQPRRNLPGRTRRAVAVPKRRTKATVQPQRARTGEGDAGAPQVRIGHGWDLHRLESIAPVGGGRPMIVGGVRMDDSGGKGPVAHSDGDALLHAVTDAILGAMAMPDIGQMFPDRSPRNEGRASVEFLAAAVAKAARAGWVVGNLDCTVICERPKIGPVKAQIRQNLARVLGVPLDRVNVKGKTHERVDAVGEGRAIEAHAVVVMVPRKKR
ncbi:MAG TPA: 2-C-methyl-D-erythritol 2,4-cyclodiphosphate synthase [Phycisphaerales bacterium]|nr:2-C-methyl-D-erythritol 2,4-cyclodiphosphate synthase [Phycisphaerales bacterium]